MKEQTYKEVAKYDHNMVYATGVTIEEETFDKYGEPCYIMSNGVIVKKYEFADCFIPE